MFLWCLKITLIKYPSFKDYINYIFSNLDVIYLLSRLQENITAQMHMYVGERILMKNGTLLMLNGPFVCRLYPFSLPEIYFWKFSANYSWKIQMLGAHNSSELLVKPYIIDSFILFYIKEKLLSAIRNANKVKAHPSLQSGGCHEVHDIEDLVKVGKVVKGLCCTLKNLVAQYVPNT